MKTMMEKMMMVLLAAITVVMVAGRDEVPSCVVTMEPCESYLSQNSTQKEPSKECCIAFQEVIKDDKSCVCTAIANPTSPYAKDVNIVRATVLPEQCSVNFGLRNCTDTTTNEKGSSTNGTSPTPTPSNSKSGTSHSPPSGSSVESPPTTKGGAAASVSTISLLGLVIGGFFLLLALLAA